MSCKSSVLCLVALMFCVCTLGYGESTDEEKEVDLQPEEFDVRDKRSLNGKPRIRIGMYEPLLCRRLAKLRKSRDTSNILSSYRTKRHSVHTHVKGKGLGFFAPIYCKGLERWLNSRKTLNGQSKFRKLRPIDCRDALEKGCKDSGVYTVFPRGSNGFDVYCDMATDGGGWTVIQRRTNGARSFYRYWKDYKTGFGDLKKEFWLGNDRIHSLTNQGRTTLRIDLGDFEGTKKYAKYKLFHVENEKHKYKLMVSGYSGSAGDSFSYNNGQYFYTLDKDNKGKCAHDRKGAWWYKSCTYANLNGAYLYGPNRADWQGITWNPWRGSKYSLKTTSMMIRRI